MYKFLGKIKKNYTKAKEASSSLPLFRIIDIKLNKFNLPFFYIQLVGKNICLKYTQKELLNNHYIYHNISEYEKIVIKEYGSSLKYSKLSCHDDGFRIINFKRKYIKSITVDNELHKTYFCIGSKQEEGERISHLTASEILEKKDIFNFLNVNDKVQVAFHAGMQDALNEQENLKILKRKPTNLIKLFFLNFTKRPTD